MIKTINYCWFGPNKKPKRVLKCIDSWKQYMPDWEIKEWNENNYDVESSKYTSKHYKNNKYAFVSDYARVDIINKHGGLYFDTDVELLKDISDLCQTNFFALEKSPGDIGTIGTGLGFYCEPNNKILQEFLDTLNDNIYMFPNDVITQIFVKYGNKILKNNKEIQECKGFKIYPWKYFCPMDYLSKTPNIQPETVAIHHYFRLW